ncbi:restriction endonuclease subunit S [Methylococcus capsulatus]|nr:restriction endonuclease subunit S [Methylococcus capsulatus]
MTRLGEIARVTSGGTPDRERPEYWGGTIPWVKTSLIQNCEINLADIDEFITEEGLKKSAAKIIPASSILMAMIGQGKTRGQVAILKTDAAINQNCAALILNEGIDARYVYQQLLYRYEELRNVSNSSGQQNLNADLIRGFKIPLADATQQAAIGGVLTDWDTAIETTERLIAAKERFYAHELSRLISCSQHPRRPNGDSASKASEPDRGSQWRTVSLSDIATVWKGQQLNKEHMEESGAYYVLNGGINPSGRTDDWNCEAGTITISEGGNSCGFVSYNSESFWCGGHCYALKNLAKAVDAHYLFHYLKGNQDRLMALRVGSGLPNIQKSDIEAFPVVLPAFTIQTAIARYLNAVREEITLLSRSLGALKRQKRGLMQKLLTGQWRVPLAQDATSPDALQEVTP